MDPGLRSVITLVCGLSSGACGWKSALPGCVKKTNSLEQKAERGRCGVRRLRDQV